MSERYTRLFSSPENLYTAGAPVIIAAGALHKDNMTDKVLAQIKMKSLSQKQIKAVSISVQPQDTTGKPLGEAVSHQYLDLHVFRDGEFGAKSPIFLPDNTCRGFTVAVTQVIFSDNSLWEWEGAQWSCLPPAKSLGRNISNAELRKQYQLELGSRSDYIYFETGNLWYCACGCLNHGQETLCHSCRKSAVKLRELDWEKLKKDMEARRAEELRLIKEESAAAEARANKVKKLALIAGAVIAGIILLWIILTNVTRNQETLNRYNIAVELMDNSRYTEAIEAFEALGDYQDSPEKIRECKYATAEALMLNEQYEDAISVFTALREYKDCPTKIKECKYAKAEALSAEGDLTHAAMMFGSASDYADARERSFALWDDIAQRDTISAGTYHTVGLKNDGTVIATEYTGDYYKGQCDVAGWTNIIAVSAGDGHTVGLKADGTVVAAGEGSWCDVAGWTDIVAISAGDMHTVGLRSDGTVVAAGVGIYNNCDVTDWTDIIAISAGPYHTVGLKADGTAMATAESEDFGVNDGQHNVDYWTGMVAISAAYNHTVGLRSSGLVCAVGDDGLDQCDVKYWKDIVAISAAYDYTVGLKSDGTVVAVGYKYDGACDVSDWTDIVAISAPRAFGGRHTVGLKKDGTVVSTVVKSSSNHGQCDVDDWENIKQP